jgi:four helix bundle protein
VSETVKYKYDIKEKSIEFSICLIKYLNGIEKQRTTLPIVDQLVRSGTSIGANIHEAQTSQSNKELMRYYRIALKSANESKYWFILLDSILEEHIDRQHLKEELNNLRNILGKTLIRLKEKETSLKTKV